MFCRYAARKYVPSGTQANYSTIAGAISFRKTARGHGILTACDALLLYQQELSLPALHIMRRKTTTLQCPGGPQANHSTTEGAIRLRTTARSKGIVTVCHAPLLFQQELSSVACTGRAGRRQLFSFSRRSAVPIKTTAAVERHDER